MQSTFILSTHIEKIMSKSHKNDGLRVGGQIHLCLIQ